MARDINDILNQEIDEKNNQSALSDLNSPSQVSIWRNMLFVHAAAIGLHEQTWDIFLAEIESKIAVAGAGTLPWLRDKILAFQAGDNVQYNNGVVAYPVINTANQIITRCSVTQDLNRTVTAKVTKQEPPVPLSTTEQNELNFYLQQIRFAGTQINVISYNSDKLYISADIYYNAQFPTIQNDVITALNNYCSGLSSATNFNGTVKVIDIEAVIKAVPGVTDIKTYQIACRPDAAPWGSRTIIYDLATGVNSRSYITVAGYIVQETTTSETFTDTLNFIAG